MKLFRKHKEEEYSDKELLDYLHETGEITHFQQLYERYMPLVYGLALKYLQRPELAQDVVIDLYESLAGKIMNYDIKVFKTWMYSVVKHHCFAILRENKKEVIVNFDSQLMESGDTLNLFDEELEEDKEVQLKTCMEKLPEPQRQSILLFFYENKSYAEIVEHTDFNLKSVKSYIQNGKRNLRICMEKALEL